MLVKERGKQDERNEVWGHSLYVLKTMKIISVHIKNIINFSEEIYEFLFKKLQNIHFLRHDKKSECLISGI